MSSGTPLVARDLSSFGELSSDDERWLRNLAKEAEPAALTLRLSRGDRDDPDPIATFEERTGTWHAGRYVGETQYRGRTLIIRPRFGETVLRRWLSRIWGVQMVSSRGSYESSRTWLWEVLAILWASRLNAAAKHGLPYIRRNEVHVGTAVRGRLDVRATCRELGRGRNALVSGFRARVVDPVIGSILVAAFRRLRMELGAHGNERGWLTDRGVSLVEEISAALHPRDLHRAELIRTVRYSPITESYRPLVELSLSILRQQPFSSSASGDNDVLGVLLDMAEIWELYVYHLLRAGLPGVRVTHSGREDIASGALLMSETSGRNLGNLKPDVLIHHASGKRIGAVLDAKYKLTTPNRERPAGVLREDLYQIAAYLAAFGKPDTKLHGALIYPEAAGSCEGVGWLQAANPWGLTANSCRAVHFIRCIADAPNAGIHQFSASELALISSIDQMLRANECV